MENEYARELRQSLHGSQDYTKKIRLAQMCAKGEGGPVDYRMAASLYEGLKIGYCGKYYDGIQQYYYGLFYETGQGSSYWVGSRDNPQYDDAPDEKKAAGYFKKARRKLGRAARKKETDVRRHPNNAERADAMRVLALLLETGRGGRVDADRAQKLREKAAAL